MSARNHRISYGSAKCILVPQRTFGIQDTLDLAILRFPVQTFGENAVDSLRSEFVFLRRILFAPSNTSLPREDEWKV